MRATVLLRPIPVGMSDSTRSVLLFLAKALAVYGVWYVVYDLWLLPDGRLDAWVSHSVVRVSHAVLSVLGLDATMDGRTLQLAGAAGVKIVNGCNGLSTIGLFMGFVVAFPGTAWRRALFLPLGAVVIYLSNVARVSLLASLQVYWTDAFTWIHDLGAPAFFYLIVFGLWVGWTHFGGASTTADGVEDGRPQTADGSRGVPV